jgi:hypothetical protein
MKVEAGDRGLGTGWLVLVFNNYGLIIEDGDGAVGNMVVDHRRQ